MAIDTTGLRKPKVQLVGQDGSAWAIMGRVSAGLRKEKWPKEKIDEVMTEMRAGDYNHLLATAMDVVDEDGED